MRTSRYLVLAATTILALSACGSRQILTAVGSMTPVPNPYGTPHQLMRLDSTAPAATAYGATMMDAPDQLLQPSTQSRPERNVELRRKSEARTDDPFDLPPE